MGRQFAAVPGVALGEVYLGGLFVPVGVGEEALFRGFLMPAFSDVLGPWGGLAASSVLFGALHIPNFQGLLSGKLDLRAAAVAIPYITLLGATNGLAVMKTGDLKTGVAMHFWYDFLLSTADFLARPDTQPFTVKITLPF
jgi:membrane protease YdiL (CAAX protease family)